MRLTSVRRVFSFRPLTFVTTLIPVSEWPDTGPFQRRDPNEATDLFVGFDSKTRMLEQDLSKLAHHESPSEFNEVKLAGMSGCAFGWIQLRRAVFGDQSHYSLE